MTQGIEGLHNTPEALKSRLGEVDQTIGKSQAVVSEALARMGEAYKHLTANVDEAMNRQLAAVRERLAVKAFNDGLINRFIRKQDPDAIVQLTTAIAELQRDYFARLEQMISEVLAVGAESILRNPAFVAIVEGMQQEKQIVEHYLLSKPQGLLMLDASGNAWRLVVMGQDALRSQAEIARDLEAPDELVRQLESGRIVPYFWRTGGEYSPLDQDWQANLYPAEVCGELRYTLVSSPPGINLDGMIPYARYLDEIDATT